MVTRFRSNGRTGRNNEEWQQGFGFLTAISKTCLLPPEQETVTHCQKSVTPLKKLLPPAIVAKTCRRAKNSHWGVALVAGFVCGNRESKRSVRQKPSLRRVLQRRRAEPDYREVKPTPLKPRVFRLNYSLWFLTQTRRSS